MTSEENQITVITPSAAESSEALPEKEKVPASVPSEFEFDRLSGWLSFVGIWFAFWLIEFWLNLNLIGFLADWVLLKFDLLSGWLSFDWIWIWSAFWLIKFYLNLIGFLAGRVLFEFDWLSGWSSFVWEFDWLSGWSSFDSIWLAFWLIKFSLSLIKLSGWSDFVCLILSPIVDVHFYIHALCIVSLVAAIALVARANTFWLSNSAATVLEGVAKLLYFQELFFEF